MEQSLFNMTYKETLDYLFSSLPMYQRIGAAAYKANLNNTLAIDNHLQHPHSSFKSVHIAGTNGKGSVSSMLAAILQKAGYRTGLYTSPHLKDFRERIKINGEMITEEYIVEFVSNNKLVLTQLEPSFFEMTVAMAFSYFSKHKTDIAVIETGMGGRLDSTNIINPVVSVITNIGLDHTQFLGNTIEEIAVEKAGIIKPGVPVIIGEWQDATHKVFEKFSRKNKSEIHWANKNMRVDSGKSIGNTCRTMDIYKGDILKFKSLATSLTGNYQDKNILTVLQTVEVLRNNGIYIPTEAIYMGMRDVKILTGFSGRWEVIGQKPLIVCDTAHNQEGLKLVIEQIQQIPWKTLHIVFGFVSDKDPSRMLAVLPVNARYYFTMANIPRALHSDKLRIIAMKKGLIGEAYLSVHEAVHAARKNAKQEDMIFIGGSNFVVGEALL